MLKEHVQTRGSGRWPIIARQIKLKFKGCISDHVRTVLLTTTGLTAFVIEKKFFSTAEGRQSYISLRE